MPIKISVIIPIYNTETYLKRCLDSIINQSYTNLEIILVDDGSTDSSGKVIDDYASNDLRIIAIHKENGGIGSAYQAAFGIMTGDYISFVDSDDYIDTEMYAELVKVAEKEDADMIKFGINKINSEGKIFQVKQSKAAIIEGNNKILNAHFTVIKTPSLGCRIFKAHLFNNIESFQRSVGVDETIFIQLIFKCEKLVLIEKPFYYAYIRTGSVSRADISIRFLRDSIDVHRFICDFVIWNNKDYKQYAYIKYIKFLYSTLIKPTGDKKILNSKEFLEVRNDYRNYYDKIKGGEILKSEKTLYRLSLRLMRVNSKVFAKILGILFRFKNV